MKVYYEGGFKEAMEAIPEIIDEWTEENRASWMMNDIVNDVYYYPDDIDNYDDSAAYVRDICVRRAEHLDSLIKGYARVFNYQIG